MARQAFFCDLVPALHHQLTHRRQQLRRQQRHVVLNRLALVSRLVSEIAVPQERPYCLVMVRKVVETVEVAVQALLQHPQYQDLPQVHSRTPNRTVRFRQNMLVQQCEQPGLQRFVTPDVLKPFNTAGISSRDFGLIQIFSTGTSPIWNCCLQISLMVMSRRFPLSGSNSRISPARIQHPPTTAYFGGAGTSIDNLNPESAPPASARPFLACAFVERACRRGFTALRPHAEPATRARRRPRRRLLRPAPRPADHIRPARHRLDARTAPRPRAARPHRGHRRPGRARLLHPHRQPVAPPTGTRLSATPTRPTPSCNRLLHDGHRIELEGRSIRRTHRTPKTRTGETR